MQRYIGLLVIPTYYNKTKQYQKSRNLIPYVWAISSSLAYACFWKVFRDNTLIFAPLLTAYFYCHFYASLYLYTVRFK